MSGPSSPAACCSPGRPRLPEARTVVIGMTDVREAWEALIARGLVPGPEREGRGAFRELAAPRR
jgi:hypothetical protein